MLFAYPLRIEEAFNVRGGVLSYVSFSFIIFISLTVLLYFALPLKKHRWVILLISSYLFYLFAGYKYIVFIVITTGSTYAVARWIDWMSRQYKDRLKTHKKEWDRETKKKVKYEAKRNKRLAMALCLVLNFGILAFLKYYNFFAGGLNDVLGVFGIGFSVPTLKLFLPLGISFYTFQSMGYLVDVYREKYPAEKNVAKLALFVSFFPQIIQGPISFHDQLAHQLYEPHKMDFTRFKYGCELILWGYFKKLIIADRAVITIETVVNNLNAYNGTTLTFTVLLYALQLYADFSGGIDISRGIAQILGIDMAENFRRPYFSKSINEYWRRWHITLGAWMKEYVFYPLSLSNAFLNAGKKIKATRFGSTKAGSHIAKVLPTAFASLIVFLIVGVWHGASWKYVAFGLWNGGVIMFSILLKPLFENALRKLRINSDSILWKLFQLFRTFIIVCIGYVFDIAPSFKQAIQIMRMVLCKQNLSEGLAQIKEVEMGYAFIAVGFIAMLLVSIVQERSSSMSVRQRLDKLPFAFRWSFLLVIVLFVAIFGIYGPVFNASDFVYAQF